eukprot:SAG11_NODE_36843_length_259_cov_1.587500_1_plen_76_part_10
MARSINDIHNEPLHQATTCVHTNSTGWAVRSDAARQGDCGDFFVGRWDMFRELVAGPDETGAFGFGTEKYHQNHRH